MSWSTSNRKYRLPKNWTSIRRAVLVRDGYKCQLRYPGCSEIATEVDHRIHGDDHAPENLQAACTACHRKKSSSEGGRASAIKRKQRIQQRYRPTERHPGRRT